MALAEDTLVVISSVLDLPDNYRLRIDTRIADVPGWDSFAWISVIEALESHYGGEFPIDDIDRFHTVGDLVQLASKKNSS